MKNNMRICLIILFINLINNFILNAEENIFYKESLTFADARYLAIFSSEDLRYSENSLLLMEKAWKWGLRAYFPQVSITASENDRLQYLGQDSFIKNYGVSLNQLIFDGGRIGIMRKLERTELDLSSAKINRMAVETGEAAIAAYRNILSSRSILEIKKKALVVLEEQKRILNEEVNLGLALEIDLRSAEINLTEARLGIQSLEIDLNEMEKQFAEILGFDEKTKLPELSEKVDINRSVTLPHVLAAISLAREKNPDLTEGRFSIEKRKAELRFASLSWVPTIKLATNFGVTGQNYPLTRRNWSIGINIDFSGPWIQNKTGFQYGLEPPYDKTAMLQNSLTPLPDPSSGINRRQAKLALDLEQEKYALIYERISRITANALEKYSFANQRRLLALQAIELGKEKCRVEEVKLSLGHITRIELMETLIEQTQREISAIEAATALLEAERELERFLDLLPGELELYAQSVNINL